MSRILVGRDRQPSWAQDNRLPYSTFQFERCPGGECAARTGAGGAPPAFVKKIRRGGTRDAS
jgi:hypothetical protein